MTTEKIINTNALSSLNRAKSQSHSQTSEKSSDIFSKHLDQKLDQADRNTNTAPRSEVNENRRQNELGLNKAIENKERNIARQEAHQEQKQQINEARKEQKLADKRLENAREEKAQADEANAENQKAQQLASKINGEAGQLETTVNDETTAETQFSENSEQQTNIDAESNISENADETLFQSSDQQEILGEEISELTAEQPLDPNAESETSTASLQEEQTQDLATPTSADENAVAANPILTKQDQDNFTNTNAKLNKEGETSQIKTPPHLESTLGQDEGQYEGKKGQNSESTGQFTNAKPDAFAPKEGTLGQNNQNQINNSPILSSNQLADQLLKGQNIKTATPDLTQLVATDTSETATSVSSNVDVKQASPAAQLRAAGYTSPTQSVAIQIAAKAQNGVQQFDIRLNPPELGRVDVRLEFTKDGQVTTHLIVERPETLDMLSKDARQLERALSQAGVDIEQDGLTFSLQDQQSQESEREEAENQFNGFDNNTSENEEQTTNINTDAIYRQLSESNGLDMSV